MPAKPSSPEYADTMTVRRISDTGRLQFGGANAFVSKLIVHEPVGLLPVADEVWELYYGPVLLAQVALKNKELHLARAH